MNGVGSEKDKEKDPSSGAREGRGRRCRECVRVRGVDTGFEPIKVETTIKAK